MIEMTVVGVYQRPLINCSREIVISCQSIIFVKLGQREITIITFVIKEYQMV